MEMHLHDIKGKVLAEGGLILQCISSGQVCVVILTWSSPDIVYGA